MIKPGTPLYTVAKIEIPDQFSLGTEASNYMAMTAHQILAAPKGLVWSKSTTNEMMKISARC